MNEASQQTLNSVVERARRRVLLQFALREGLLAGTVFLASLALLFALGTDWFPSSLLLVFGLGGLALAVYRWVRLRPTPYTIAQQLDVAWATSDQISTAYFFRSEAARRGGLAALQGRLAASAAHGDLGQALPLRMPVTAFSAGAALLLTLGLLAVRYGTHSELSFRPPLAPIGLLAGAPGGDNDTQESVDQQPSPTPDSPEAAPSLSDEGRLASEVQREGAETIEVASEGDADGAAAEEFPLPEVEGLSLDGGYGDALAADGEAQPTDGGGQEASDGGDQRADASSSQPDADDTSTAEPSNDLLSRLRDALNNMISALSPDQMRDARSERASAQSPSGSSEQEAAAGAEAGQEGQEGRSDSESGGSASSEGLQQATQGGASGQGDDAGSEQEGVASAGSADGSKEMKEAAQLEAMGEISKLYQQRADEISGEVLIETRAARQDLSTPYRPTDARHQDRGGIVSRDEIPLAYRGYIQAYFENLKQSPKN